MKKYLQHLSLAILLVIAQVFIFNNLQLRGLLSSFVTPSVYIFYLLIMPLSTPKIQLLMVSFLLGISVDIFSGSLGINAAACVLIGFLRPRILPLFLTHEKRTKDVRPSIYTMGAIHFLNYCALLSSFFYLALFLLEVFTLYEFYFTIIRVILSCIASSCIMMIFQFLFARRTHRYK